jgi:DNA polymerase-3 subunit epsilon
MEQSSWGIGGFIDVETTGLNPSKDEIIEFALVLFSFDRNSGEILKVVDEYSGLREPSCSISREASKVHGITKRAIRGMTLDKNRIEAMLEQTEFLVAHNANFDLGFVARLFPASTLKPWFCSMQGIDWKAKGFASRGLQNLLRDHGIEVAQSHRALDDAKAALTLLSRCSKNGETYFAELLRNGPLICIGHMDKVAATLDNVNQQSAPQINEVGRRQPKGCTPILLVAILIPLILWLLIRVL